jgi:hypothetical protein
MNEQSTHPLTAGNYSADESVLATHPELAAPVSAQILAEDSPAVSTA